VKPIEEYKKVEKWMLDPTISYINHGSFGARLREVYEFQQELKAELERSPVDFLLRQGYRLEEARNVVAGFLGADIDGFGFVDNATTGIGCAIQDIELESGDEILVTDHVYNGVRQLLKHKASYSNCSYREIEIGLTITNNGQIIEKVESAITSATKVLVIDHVASATSIVFPVKEIIKICRNKGVFVIVDGAHAPGMLDLNICDLNPDWYVGNLHKWVCAPLGAGFIWASKEQRANTHPMTISHPYLEGYKREFEWQGTKDITPWLSSSEAVKIWQEVGWEEIRKHNHELATWMQLTLVQEFGVTEVSALDGSMIGNMATVRLPDWCPNNMDSCLLFMNELFTKYQIEVPVFEFQGNAVIRVSAQLYSAKSDITTLISAIEDKHVCNSDLTP
jgi:isopenicillin-N epimerase